MKRRQPDWVIEHPRAGGVMIMAAVLLYLSLLVQLPQSVAMLGTVAIGVVASLVTWGLAPRRGRRRGAPPHEIGDA